MNSSLNGLFRIKGLTWFVAAIAVCLQTAVFGQNFTFTANNYSVGDGIEDPIAVVAVSLTNNSLPNLYTANIEGYLSEITNNGSGGFGLDGNFSLYVPATGGYIGQPYTYGVIPAYINGPGASNLDLIVLSDDGDLTEYPNEMDIWANNGGDFNDSYQTAIVEGGPWLYSIAIANISQTNKPDMICSYDETDLALYTNNYQGSFNFYATFPVGADPYDIIAADLNSNGTIDVVSANEGANTLTVTPITTGQPPAIGTSFTLAVGSGPKSVAAADLRGSGKLDLVSANAGGTLTIYTNNGSGGFGSNATLNVGSAAQSVAAVDLNGDGRPDLVCGNGGSLTIFVNNGSGVFTSNVTLNVGSIAVDVISADVNGDGKPDLVCINGDDSIAVLINTAVRNTIVPWVNIAATNNQVKLNWPTWATNYFLEFTTNLNAPNWTPVNNAVPAAGNVTLTNSWPAAYFRLQEF